MTMAYRVEYPPYKIQLDDGNKITGFHGGTDPTISISFVKPDHSDYFSRERSSNPKLRVVEFEITQDCWDAILWRSASKVAKKDVKQKWVDLVGKVKEPAWSDGANLDRFTKQTALTFSGGWLDALLQGLAGGRKARVWYPGDDEDGLEDGDEVWGYVEGDGDDEGPEHGYAIPKDEAEKQGLKYMTVHKAERLGYRTDD